MLPRYPIYIVSKGRWESRLTARALEKIDIPYYIVVESSEYKKYAAVICSEKILELPFSDLGQGSIPARNWIWEHAIESGTKRHWILDDNIDGFYWLTDNTKYHVRTAIPFCAAEDFVDRYKNIALAGFQYDFFRPRKEPVSRPYILNTRIYSCILVKNDLIYRWRGKYNEDTDLSLRVLKAGWCTILFQIFLAKKIATMRMKGGNTDELYAKDGRLLMAQSLQKQHPDVVRVGRRWNRWQHIVDYSRFRRNQLVLCDDINIPTDNNYIVQFISN